MSIRYVKGMIISVLLLLFIVSPVNAGIWKVGDSIAIYVLCRYEEDIMNVVKADMISGDSVIGLINSFIAYERCIVFPKIAHFRVKEIIVNYKDFRSRPSCVLKVYYNMNKNLEGFVIAENPKDDAI